MGEEREFQFRDVDFRRVKSLIHEKAGINLSDNKKQLVYSRLARRVRALGFDSFSRYLDFLAQNEGELEHFTNALTTNLTSFFREGHHFDLLASQAVSLRPAPGPLRVWCAAASTGEEPYSIAISLCQAFGTLTPPVEILATDIDSDVLRHAQQGIYPLERISAVPLDVKKHFFWRGKRQLEGKARVIPDLQKLIRFQRLNLLEPAWPFEGPFEVIFCRNVMIYFDKSTQHRLLERMVSLMPAQGLYFAGHSESFIHARDLVELIGRSAYRPAPKARICL